MWTKSQFKINTKSHELGLNGPQTQNEIQKEYISNSIATDVMVEKFIKIHGFKKVFKILNANALFSPVFLNSRAAARYRPWHQLYRAARGSPGSCHFSFLSIFHE
jgi:hypothetical protein